MEKIIKEDYDLFPQSTLALRTLRYNGQPDHWDINYVDPGQK